MTAILVFMVEMMVVCGIFGLVGTVLLLSARSEAEDSDFSKERSGFMCKKNGVVRHIAKVMVLVMMVCLGYMGNSKASNKYDCRDAEEHLRKTARI